MVKVRGRRKKIHQKTQILAKICRRKMRQKGAMEWEIAVRSATNKSVAVESGEGQGLVTERMVLVLGVLVQ